MESNSKNSKHNCASYKLVEKIVSAMLPEKPVVYSDLRRKVEDDVSDFVYGQIEALPVYLRVIYKIVLCKFNFSSFFIYGNVFSNLNKSKQLNYSRMWSESPIRQMRDFIKLIKSCAFLQYFDHPVILEAIIIQNENNEKQLQTGKN